MATEPRRLQTVLGYVVQAGLISTLIFGLLNGYFLLSDASDPSRQIENLPVQPTGPQIRLGNTPPLPTSGTIPSEEYYLTSALFEISIFLTGGAIIAQIFLIREHPRRPIYP